MTQHLRIGQLHQLHEMLEQLFNSVAEPHAYLGYAEQAPPLAWIFGRTVYREALALREWLQGEDQLTSRVRHLFEPALPDAAIMAGMPPRDHLLNWALEIFEEDLLRLANPNLLPDHPVVRDGRLVQHLLRELSSGYEQMLELLTWRRLAIDDGSFRVEHPLEAALSSEPPIAVSQGHYRIGARVEDNAAMDCELPTQMVELSSFRIASRPVSNAEFLAFMDDGGYARAELFGDTDPRLSDADAPLNWRRDAAGNWYGMGFNGPTALVPNAPVSGINRHEAAAFAHWLSTQGEQWEGAVLQHEYQREVAARMGHLDGVAEVWEWCANEFHPYSEFQPFDSPWNRCEAARGQGVLRGGCLHSQPLLRRASHRRPQPAAQRMLFGGIRLVFPPTPHVCGRDG